MASSEQLTLTWQLRPIAGEIGTLPAVTVPWYEAAHVRRLIALLPDRHSLALRPPFFAATRSRYVAPPAPICSIAHRDTRIGKHLRHWTATCSPPGAVRRLSIYGTFAAPS
jgi:hypothetical protein